MNKSIRDGIHANNPVAYITAIIRNRIENSSQCYQKYEKIYEKQWYSDDDGEDELFRKMSNDDQGVVRLFRKHTDNHGWYIAFIKNKCPSAYKYLIHKGLIKNGNGQAA